MIIKFFQKIDFFSTNIDSWIFIIKLKDKLIIVSIYINNLLLRLKSYNTLGQPKNQFMKKSNIKNFGKGQNNDWKRDYLRPYNRDVKDLLEKIYTKFSGIQRNDLIPSNNFSN